MSFLSLLILIAATMPRTTVRPFLDPLDLHNHWLWLLPPLAFGIALVYKTLKLPNLDQLWLQTFRLTAVILIIAALAGGVLWLLVEII